MTDYGLDGPGIESQWGEIFALQTDTGAHPPSCTMGTGSLLGVKYGRGVLLTTHPFLMPRSWKSRAITLPTLGATTGPVTRTLYLYLLLSTLNLIESRISYLFIYNISIYSFAHLPPLGGLYLPGVATSLTRPCLVSRTEHSIEISNTKYQNVSSIVWDSAHFLVIFFVFKHKIPVTDLLTSSDIKVACQKEPL